jgi:hypothetical protein
LQGEVHPLPYISMDKFPMFFRNALEDAVKHLIKFDGAYEIYIVVEDDIACQLFILTPKENTSEQYYSLLPGTITNQDVLENICREILPKKRSIFSFLKVD